MRTAKYIGIFGLLVVLLAGSLGAVVIVPPLIYFASISIAGFLANALISLGALAAVAGVANWKLFNSPAPAIISTLFGVASKLFIGISTMTIALIAFSPISLQQIILSASFVLLVSAFFLFLRDYRIYRASPKTVKLQLFKSIALFALFFSLVFAPSAYFAIEHRVISTQQEKTSASWLPSAPAAQPLLPDRGAAAKQAPSPLAEASSDYKESAEPQQGSLTLWFLPQSKENCIVEIGSAMETFKPRKECKPQPNVFSEPEWCPVSIQVPRQCQNDLKIIASGSCSDSILLQCDSSQLK